MLRFAVEEVKAYCLEAAAAGAARPPLYGGNPYGGFESHFAGNNTQIKFRSVASLANAQIYAQRRCRSDLVNGS
jgi:hypothetical protein